MLCRACRSLSLDFATSAVFVMWSIPGPGFVDIVCQSANKGNALARKLGVLCCVCAAGQDGHKISEADAAVPHPKSREGQSAVG